MYFTYIAANKSNTVLYIGITNDLARRMSEHRRKSVPGFTARYNVKKLVWYEAFERPYDAIAAEKKIKGWRRSKKIGLIRKTNPNFDDLFGGDSSRSSE